MNPDTEQEGSAKRRSLTPGRNSPEKDNILTPDALALQIVRHYRPQGSVYIPFAGDGAFFRAVKTVNHGAAISETESRVGASYYTGTDFFDTRKTFDWAADNPPYSIFTAVLEHSFTLADNIVYLVQAPAPFFVARRRAAKEAGFGIREMFYVNCPDEWKKQKISFGTGLAAVHWQRGYQGSLIESYAPDFVFPRKAGRGAA